MSSSDARRLVDRLGALGAATAEVYVKAGRSVRLARDRDGVIREASVREDGVALRAWGAEGQEGFASSILDVPIGVERALRRIGISIGETRAAPAEAPPDLPSGPGGACSDSRSFESDAGTASLAAMGREALGGLDGEFGRPGREAVRLEGAWWEAGTTRTTLLNSSGFEGVRTAHGWQLIVALRTGAAAESRLCLLAWRGEGSAKPDPGRIAEEAAWRAAAPIGGVPVRNAERAPALIDSILAAQVLQALGPWFVASDAGYEALGRGERLGPPGLEIRESAGVRGTGSSWDDEGVTASDRTLVKDGCLVGLLTDLGSARRFGLPRTGSARRPSFRDRPEARPARLSLSFEGGTADGSTLLERLRPGLFLTEGRMILSEGGFGGAILGGGLRVDGGRALEPVGRVFLQGGPRALLRSLRAVSGPSRPGEPIGTPAAGSWLVDAEMFAV